MYPVLENTSYPSERTQTERRWSNFKPSKMAVNRTNNMGGATLPSCIRSYQTPVTSVTRTRPWKRWSNFKPSEWDGCQQNKQHGSCYIALIYPVVPNTSYPSERTWPGRRWSNFKSSKMAINRTNKQHGRCCTPLVYSVVPNTSYPSETTWRWRRWRYIPIDSHGATEAVLDPCWPFFHCRCCL